MTESPFFSVVIPTYNREDFIEATLRSVLEQTFEDYEVIIVDNCSTDRTIHKIEPFLSDKVKLVQHERNFERAKSRNTGMRAARGEYLTFLDSDDFMYPSNLQDAFAFASANPEVKFFHNLFELVNAEREVLHRHPVNFALDTTELISRGNFLACIGVFIHREIYRSVFWDESPWLTGSEDYDYWLRVLSKFPRLGHIHKINSGVLHHDSRTVNNQEIETVKHRFDLLIRKWTDDVEFMTFYGPRFKNIQSTLDLFTAGLLMEYGRNFDSLKLLWHVLLRNSRVFKWKNYQKLVILNFLKLFDFRKGT